MAAIGVYWSAQSRNEKTGPIPVSTTAKSTCSPSCPLREELLGGQGGCYAANSHTGVFWQRLSDAGPDAAFKHGRGFAYSIGWSAMLDNVAALPAGQLWRHNQAGDLPHTNGAIDAAAVSALTEANAASGARGFTYTHHDMAIAGNVDAVRDANARGLTINLSGNNLEHADQLAALEAGPVVTLLAADAVGNVKLATPAGRKVVVCPATYRDDVTCASCGLCAVADRKVIVGFPAHGAAKRKASAIAA